jgi:biopolymer transport protein ExbD
MEFERRRQNHSHLNIAPLVDVVFLLILFFMLTSHFVQEPSIRIRLPISKTAEAHNGKVKTILITRESEIYLMDKKVDLKNLQKEIRSLAAEPEKEVFQIKADREARVGIMVNVIDEVRLAGVKTFSVVTERR